MSDKLDETKPDIEARRDPKLAAKVAVRERKLDVWDRTGVNPDYVDARGRAILGPTVLVDGARVGVHSREYLRDQARKLRR